MIDTCHRCGSVGGFGCYECIPDMIPRAEADARVAADRQRIVESVKAFRVHFSFGEVATLSDVQKLTAESYIRAVENAALTPDDARAALDQMISDAVNEATRLTVPIAALDAMLAEAEKRGKKRGMLRAHDALVIVPAASKEQEHAIQMCQAAIRAEAEE